jgi:VWFA-related protein
MNSNVSCKAIVVTVLLLSFSSFAHAQQEPAFPTTPVKVVVAAEARHGKDVPQIRSEDVVVMQAKQRQKVIAWQPIASSQLGAQIFLLIDDSLSTSDLGSKLNDIRDFINSQPATVQVGVAYMRNGTALVTQHLTTDHGQAAKALRLPTGDSGASASPYFSLQDLLKHWPQDDAAREVIMITDGIDAYWDSNSLDDPYVNSAIEQAQRQGVVVNAIYARGEGHLGHTFWRINSGQNFLSEIADGTGGEAYYLANDSPVSFTPYFNELTERMKHQYLLTFDAQPGPKSGFQPIKVSTEVPNVDLVAPKRVYVPTGS